MVINNRSEQRCPHTHRKNKNRVAGFWDIVKMRTLQGDFKNICFKQQYKLFNSTKK